MNTTPFYVEHKRAASDYFELLRTVLDEFKIAKGMGNLLALIRLIDLENFLANATPEFIRDEDLARLLDDLGISYDFVIFANNSEYKPNNLDSISKDNVLEANTIEATNVTLIQHHNVTFKSEILDKRTFNDDALKDTISIVYRLPESADISSIQDYPQMLTINYTVASDDVTPADHMDVMMLTFYKTNVHLVENFLEMPGQYIGNSVFFDSNGGIHNYAVYLETEVELDGDAEEVTED
ncbi:hypothetical protein MA9V2_155 [Chryseobacterium phage MA9V-2]|nr:hypothetical protein MA9V2_155 [Chryseobacterium phage MA9V-2]